MTKAKLIKKQEVIEREQAKQVETQQKPVLKATVETVTKLFEKQSSNKRQDPRKAFAALFGQPQTQNS